jgi:hypothetical protein
MSLTYGPKTFDAVPTSASAVQVLNWSDQSPATLSSPVQISSSGAVSFTVANPGTYTVKVRTPVASFTDRVFLGSVPSYDITDPRSYAQSLGGSGSDVNAAPKSSVSALVLKNEGNGTWPPRPTGFAAVTWRGSDPSPLDMVTGDVREIPVT